MYLYELPIFYNKRLLHFNRKNYENQGKNNIPIQTQRAVFNLQGVANHLGVLWERKL